MPDTHAETVASRTSRRPHVASGPGAADLAAIAIGGGLGTLARYLLSTAFPAGHGFPWAIFAVNVSGSFLLGVLMVYLLEIWPPRRFVRPFLAVGLIGGYTTFSTYAGGVLTLLVRGATVLAFAYALGSILVAFAAVWCGVHAARLPARLRERRAGGAE